MNTIKATFVTLLSVLPVACSLKPSPDGNKIQSHFERQTFLPSLARTNIVSTDSQTEALIENLPSKDAVRELQDYTRSSAFWTYPSDNDKVQGSGIVITKEQRLNVVGDQKCGYAERNAKATRIVSLERQDGTTLRAALLCMAYTTTDSQTHYGWAPMCVFNDKWYPIGEIVLSKVQGGRLQICSPGGGPTYYGANWEFVDNAATSQKLCGSNCCVKPFGQPAKPLEDGHFKDVFGCSPLGHLILTGWKDPGIY